MHIIWSLEGTTVWLTGATVHSNPCFEGIVRKGNEVWQWSAQPNPQGFEVLWVNEFGRRKLYQGPTFNLGLEVAACGNT